MIQANELMLGNFVDTPDGTVKITAISYEKVAVIRKTEKGDFAVYSESLDDIQPIPLTKEILLKCPQAKRNEKSIITKNYILPLRRNTYLSISDIGTPSGFIWLCNEEDGRTTDLICLYNYDYDGDFYIHKLQDIYYALTGEELEVNL